MGGYAASVESKDDGTVGAAGPVTVGLRNARTGMLQELSIDEFTGGHLLHLAVAGCVYNDLWREAAARDIRLTRVHVTADGAFEGDPCRSTGVTYRVSVEGESPESELRALVAHVEQIAEIPSALRLGLEVRLGAGEVTSTG